MMHGPIYTKTGIFPFIYLWLFYGAISNTHYVMLNGGVTVNYKLVGVSKETFVC